MILDFDFSFRISISWFSADWFLVLGLVLIANLISGFGSGSPIVMSDWVFCLCFLLRVLVLMLDPYFGPWVSGFRFLLQVLGFDVES